MSIAQQYSGIVINQNAPATRLVSAETMLFTTFTLPDDYVRGEDTQIIPPLTGFQVFCNVSSGQAATATLTWQLELLVGAAWQTLASAITTGTAHDGAVWFTVLIDPPLAVQQAWLDSQFRLGVRGSGGLAAVKLP